MMPKADEATLPHSGEMRWWRELFLDTHWRNGKEAAASSSRRQSAAVPTCKAGSQTRTFNPRNWLRWRWKKAEPDMEHLRSKMRWGSLSYIATTWDEELTPADCSGPSVPSEVKVDGDGNSGRQCQPDVRDPGDSGEVPEEGAGVILARERMAQALLFGATFAATMYVVYRISFRQRWWRWRHMDGRKASGDGHDESGDDTDESGGDDAKEALRGFGAGDIEDNDYDSDSTPESTVNGVEETQEGSAADSEDTAASIRAPEVTPGSPGRDGPSDTESVTESVLAEADDLIAADLAMPLLPGNILTVAPGKFLKVSGEEVDALVNLTRRVIARDPAALSEIARQAAAQSVKRSAAGDTSADVSSIALCGGRASVEGGDTTSIVSSKIVAAASSDDHQERWVA